MGVPIESEVNEVFMGSAKFTFEHCGTQPSENTLESRFFTGVPIESEANKVFLGGVKSTFIHCGI